MQPRTRMGRTLALTAALAGLFVALGVVDGVFARLGMPLVLSLGAFVLGFASVAWALDAELRAWTLAALRRRPPAALRTSAASPPAARRDARSLRDTSARGSAAPRARSAG